VAILLGMVIRGLLITLFPAIHRRTCCQRTDPATVLDVMGVAAGRRLLDKRKGEYNETPRTD
jgi:hypothetical protein